MPTVIPLTPALGTSLSLGNKHYKPQYSLDNLVQDIKTYLGSSSGISSKDVDNEYLISLAQKYVSDPNDWARYFYNDTSKNYTRNAIENINQKANILLLVWNPGKGSPVHDHANAHCIMKILAGTLQETVYRIPEGDDRGPLEIKSDTRHGMNDVAYISDDIGLHRVHNPSSDQIAVSLHLYTPPNAADYGYNVYNENTGKASFVPQAKAVELKE
ncbi:Cysteine dioxygenase type I [Penicillium bovifimosum]|uniref:Cysteine dioxygenase n=1 Tax=Penicillium bovifimosum TaxID=126998 RepID=A0A9W9GHN6_9EURO|nr:Cysteine dioxygenase type I [Penicillium bovifimosum]KAJ5120436.1 Cysteine dioxygenase type I [Penicillium bovifimosum]